MTQGGTDTPNRLFMKGSNSLFSLSDLLCSKSSISKYNTSTIDYWLVVSLHFNLITVHETTDLSWLEWCVSTVWRRCRPSSRWWLHPGDQTSAEPWWPWGSCAILCEGLRSRSWPSSACGCSMSCRRLKGQGSWDRDEHAGSQTAAWNIFMKNIS